MPPHLQNVKTDFVAPSRAEGGPTVSFKQNSAKQQSLVTRFLRFEPGIANGARDAVHELANDVMSVNAVIHSPFGAKVVSFADYSASGKALRSIEDYIHQHVLPLFGDSHESSSATVIQTASFLEEARRTIVDETNAFIDGPDAVDRLILTEPGSTGAIERLIAELGLHKSSSDTIVAADTRPIVFVGPFDQPSDVRRWRESAAEVVSIPENGAGHVDMKALKRSLEHYGNRSLKIGVFSASSSLTGLLTDVDAVTALLHQNGALSLWDYSAAAPYVTIDMNPVPNGSGSIAKDAIFFSGHKFIGGRGSPSVLIVKKKLLSNAVNTSSDLEDPHQLSDSFVDHEQGDQADAIGSIRLGLALQLKQSVGAASVAKLERHHVNRVRESLAESPNIVLLGHDDFMNHRLPFFSFLVRFGDRFLHYNFVGALLNDLFGIQVCVAFQGPYGARLLGLSTNDRLALERAVEARNDVLKPGFLHMSFPYFMGDAEADYILDAIHFVASEGWKFLSQYSFDRITGDWTRRGRTSGLRPQQLSKLSGANSKRQSELVLNASQLADHRMHNMKLARSLARHCETAPIEDFCSVTLDVSLEGLRWFIYPVEAVAALRSRAVPELSTGITGPFQPEMYMEGAVGDRWTIRVKTDREPAATRSARARARLRRLVDFCARFSWNKHAWGKIPGSKRDRSANAAPTRCEGIEVTTISWCVLLLSNELL